MTFKEKSETLQAFRTLMATVGLSDAREWLRAEDLDLEHELMDYINTDVDGNADGAVVEHAGFHASDAHWRDAARYFEESLPKKKAQS